MESGGSTAMQGSAYGPYAQAGGGPDLNTLSALLDPSSAGTMQHGDGNLSHDAYQQNRGGGNQAPASPNADHSPQMQMSSGMQDVGVTYGAIDGVQQGEISKPMTTPRTLPIVLTNYMRAQGKPVTEEDLCVEVGKVYNDLRKPDGTRYTGNLERAVRGSLCSTGMFDKLSNGTWTLREEQTRDYERRLMDRITKQEADKNNKRRRRESSRAEEGEGEGGERQKRKYVRKNPATRLKRGAKREAILDMLGSISDDLRTQSNWNSCYSNPFKGFKGDEQVDDVWKKLGNDKFIFMLQMFNYLTDLIQNRHLIQEQIAKNNSKNKDSARRAEEKSGRNENAHNIPESYSGLNSSLGSLEDLLQKLTNRVGGVENLMTNQSVWNAPRSEV